jgi:hypothetical protein
VSSALSSNFSTAKTKTKHPQTTTKDPQGRLFFNQLVDFCPRGAGFRENDSRPQPSWFVTEQQEVVVEF